MQLLHVLLFIPFSILTLDEENVEAFQGVSNLISVNLPAKDDHTQGIGYYASSKRHDAIKGQANFDQTLTSGTDIYIAGSLIEKERNN